MPRDRLMVEYQPVITGSKATTQRCSLRFPRRFLSVLSLFILAKNRRHFPHSYFHIDGNKHSSLRASSPGALTAGREKEEELATTCLEYLNISASKKSMRNSDWRR